MTSPREVFDAIEGRELPEGYVWAGANQFVRHITRIGDWRALCGKTTWKGVIWAKDRACRTCWKCLARREGA